MTTVDGHVIALNADDGAVIWDVRLTDLDKGETVREAPLVARGKVYVGDSGDDNGARGWIAALDETTGRELWRRYSTGPDAEVGIGAGFRTAAGTNLGVSSWPSDAWKRGGGGLAGPILYDAELNQILYATGHPAPWNPDQRQGDNRWTSGVFARDADTGEARWFASFAAHDPFAFGAGAAGVLTTREEGGAKRKLLLHADPNGYVYVVDRESGDVLSRAHYVNVNALGRAARQDVIVRDVCPGWPGALGAAPALSPDGKLLLIPASRLCMDMEARNVSFIKGTAYVGADVRAKAPRDGHGGALIGWDIKAGKPAWALSELFPVVSTPLVQGDVVLYGTLDGNLNSVELATGKPIGGRRLASGVISAPVSWRDGVAVLAGVGGTFGQTADPAIDIRDATAAHGFGNLRPPLPQPDDASGRLYLFAP